MTSQSHVLTLYYQVTLPYGNQHHQFFICLYMHLVSYLNLFIFFNRSSHSVNTE